MFGAGYLFLIVAVVWLVHMIPRIPNDINEFINTNEPLDRVVNIVLWSITGFFLFTLGRFAWRLIALIIDAL